ncbi:hypothetical protein MMC31_002701 [Peltigera leucophlebia]|nr:hypothetical protein [Peltigera leucophlebia]
MSVDMALASPRDSTPLSVALPSLQTRRAACTHLTVARVYGPNCCSICHRPSRFGWLYQCTQDEQQHEEVSATATGDLEHENGENGASGYNTSNDSINATRLSPWIEKAIQEGHYTPDQIFLMRVQRQNVMQSIAAAEDYMMEHPELDSPPATHPSTIPLTAKVKGLLPDRSRSEIQAVKEPEPSPAAVNLRRASKPQIFPACKFRYCQICRPTFRDRAWIKFDDIFADKSCVLTIDFDHDDRPISLLNLVCNLGLREARLPRCQYGTKRHILPSGLYHRRTISPDDPRIESERNSFRRGVMRAFRGMLMSGRRSSRSRSRPASGRRSQMLKDVDATNGCDLGLWRSLDDELLQLATSVHLPGHDGMDGLGTEDAEIEVEDGIAVTEEGVDLGAADVIIQV